MSEHIRAQMGTQPFCLLRVFCWCLLFVFFVLCFFVISGVGNLIIHTRLARFFSVGDLGKSKTYICVFFLSFYMDQVFVHTVHLSTQNGKLHSLFVFYFVAKIFFSFLLCLFFLCYTHLSCDITVIRLDKERNISWHKMGHGILIDARSFFSVSTIFGCSERKASEGRQKRYVCPFFRQSSGHLLALFSQRSRCALQCVCEQQRACMCVCVRMLVYVCVGGGGHSNKHLGRRELALRRLNFALYCKLEPEIGMT